MTNLEQALSYVQRELKFMATDSAGTQNQHKCADKVIYDVVGVPNLCTTALASSRPNAVILNAVRGPRGNALMKFFNCTLHDARIEMTLVVSEATKLKGRKSRKSRDSYDYLSSMYQQAVRKARNLVLGRNDTTTPYRDQFANLARFAGYGGAGIDGYDDDDEYDFTSSIMYGDDGYAADALDQLRNGQIPPAPPSTWAPAYTPGLTGNDDLIRQIRALEEKIGRPMTESEIDSYLTGEKVVKADFSSSPVLDEEFFANLGRTQQASAAAIPEDLKEAFWNSPEFQGILSQAFAAFVQQQREPVPPAPPPSATEVTDVDPLTAGKTTIETSAEVVEPPVEPAAAAKSDSDLAALIQQRNLAAANPNKAAVEPEPAPEPAAEEDSSSNQPGPVDKTGPSISEEPQASEKETGEPTPEAPPVKELSEHAKQMNDLITTFEDINYRELAARYENVFAQSGSELKDSFIALTASEDPDVSLNLQVYLKAAHSSELVPQMAIINAASEFVVRTASTLCIPSDKIRINTVVAEGNTTFDEDLRTAYGKSQLFWKEGIVRNLQYTAIIALFIEKYATLPVHVSYVSNYPSELAECPTFVFSVYPKVEGQTFDDVRAAFSLISSDTWALLCGRFSAAEDITLISDWITNLRISVRIPENLDSEVYLEGFADPDIDKVREGQLEDIGGLNSFIIATMNMIKNDLATRIDGPINCTIGHEMCVATSRDVLDFDSILSVYPDKELSDEEAGDLERSVNYSADSSMNMIVCMLASASRVGSSTFIKVINPSSDDESDGGDGLDAQTRELEAQRPQLVNNIVDALVGEATGIPTEGQTNSFGLQ